MDHGWHNLGLKLNNIRNVRKQYFLDKGQENMYTLNTQYMLTLESQCIPVEVVNLSSKIKY